jgi:CRISPR-associated protein Cas4
MNNKLVIKASGFGTHDYCEWKWYLENVLGEEIPTTKEMTKGALVHQEKEDKFLEVATPTTVEKFLASTKYTLTKEIPLKKEFEELLLVGKIDELAVDKGNVYVIDDKPNAHPWLGTKRQIWAYCLLFKGNFPKIHKRIIAILRDRDTDAEVWQKDFDAADEKEILAVMERMTKLFRKEIEPVPCSYPNKCKACVLHKEGKCKHSCA